MSRRSKNPYLHKVILIPKKNNVWKDYILQDELFEIIKFNKTNINIISFYEDSETGLTFHRQLSKNVYIMYYIDPLANRKVIFSP